MSRIDCGRVCPLDKGTYNASTQYEVLDMVRYNGGVYFCTNTPPSIGVLPTNTDYFSALTEANIWEEMDIQHTAISGGVSWDIVGDDRYDYEYLVSASILGKISGGVSLVVDASFNNASYCSKKSDSNDIVVWSANLNIEHSLSNKFVLTAKGDEEESITWALYRRKRTNYFEWDY